MDFQHAREVFEHALLWGALGGAVLLALVCLFHYAAKSFADTLRRAGLTKRGMGYAFWAFCLVVFVSYAGTKPSNALRSARSTETEEDGPFPSARSSLTDEDYTAGFALSRIGTNETWSFEAPDDAVLKEEWRELGAANVWFRFKFEDDWTFPVGTNTISALTVFPHGTLRPRTKDTATHISPLNTPMGLAWASRWEELDESARPSQFWHLYTPSNTLIMTWQNALLGQSAGRPVSFQVEFLANGDLDFRYDLSRLPGEAISNLTVGVMNAGVGRAFTAISNNTTSLRWARLDSTLADPDPDDDGLTTDEEVLLYHTDPYAKDSDYDGLDDKYEVETEGLDPLNAHSLDERYCDSVAQIIGDVDPWSCPEGSTNTVWEHVFYTGTTNQPFAYPVATDDTAILDVIVSGSGGGELILGDLVVPLLAPSTGISLASNDNSSNETARVANHVAVARDEWYRCRLQIPETLQVEIDSDCFTVGRLPDSFLRGHWGWLAFPRTTATEPCIHDLYARERDVTLETSIEDVTCTWVSTDDVTAENSPPLSATLTGHFARDSETPVTYSLAHPLYLFGETNYVQTARYCPKIADEDLPFTDEEDEEEDVERPENLCPIHGGPYDECRNLHVTAYTNNVARAVSGNLLKLCRTPTYTVEIPIEVAENAPECCGCPDHDPRTVTVAAQGSRLSITDAAGVEFVSTNEDCSVFVQGLSPSRAINDTPFALCRTGALYQARNFTVLGVGFSSLSSDFPALIQLNEDVGFLFVAASSPERGEGIYLETQVGLDFGDVALSLESESATGFKVYLGWGTEDKELLLDTKGTNSVICSLAEWKERSSTFSSGYKTRITLVADGPGKATLRIGYAGDQDGMVVSDEAALRLTAILPPFVPDMNRDGYFTDVDRALAVSNRFYFWTNRDVWEDDDAFAKWYLTETIEDWFASTNGDDSEVNGHNDLVNILPIAILLEDVKALWPTHTVTMTVWPTPGDESCMRRCYGFLSSTTKNASVLTDNTVVNESSSWQFLYNPILCEAELKDLDEAESLPDDLQELVAGSNAVVYVEGKEECLAPIELVFYVDGMRCLACRPDIKFSDVDDMYRWHNIRAAAGGEVDNPQTYKTIGDPSGWPDAEHDDINLYFVHGYNISEAGAREWGRAFFKRMWWSGFNGRFHVITWYGNDSQEYIPTVGLVSRDYYVNVEHAFASAESLCDIVNNYTGRTYIAAHSLGNMVVSSAIQDFDLPHDKYFLLNAAVPAEAYDESTNTVNETSIYNLTPEDWHDLPSCVRASHWYEHPGFAEGDGRKKLTWKGRFLNVTNVVNYYSSEDQVLQMGDGDDIVPTSAAYAWYNQERHKGNLLLGQSGREEGGWGFNPVHEISTLTGFRPRTEDELSEITADFREEPFFLPFQKELNGALVKDDSLHTTNAVPELTRERHAQLLADAIPAESPPVGWSSVICWATKEEENSGEDQGSESISINMATSSIDKETVILMDSENQKWIHSYFLSAPYMVVHLFFESMADKIEGDKR